MAGEESATPVGDQDEAATEAATEETVTEPVAEAAAEEPALEVPVVEEPAPDATGDARLAQERLADLQRLQAEYVNYRRRVERDRDVARDQAVAGVLEALLPVLDDVHLARQHGDLEGGPFASIADKLEGVLGRFGLARYGEAGEGFDPAVHEALLHVPAAQAAEQLSASLGRAATIESATVVQVLQPGYRAGERVLRPARVSVADPD